MLFTIPVKEWDGSDVYIIGGGPSLTGFDFSLLRGKNVIGCNVAFRLGVEVCPVCFFCDKKWFLQFQDELQAYVTKGGRVFTCSSELMALGQPLPVWLKFLMRHKRGLHRGAVGMNGNSGCSAVNLALNMGAKRVFLLGFDCRLEPTDKTHWHDWRIEKPNPSVYNKFMEGWVCIAAELNRVFPGSEIINLGPDSAIECFPKEDYRNLLSHAENYCTAS